MDSRSRTLKSIFTSVAAILLCFGTVLAADEKPNFVFFIGDDISQEDFGCYGHKVIKTPNVDALASNGMRFDNAYLTISSCSPSRISIITGRYPHNTGAPELHVKIPKDQVCFTKLLRENGYYTVLSGKNHMVPKDSDAFDKITTGGGPGNSDNWVDHVKNRPKEKPFFFWFAAADAHRVWQESDEVIKYKPESVVVPPYYVDSAATRADLASYCHEVSRFDHFIGLVRDELRAQAVLDNTFIVVCADNGRPFPRAKGTVYDSGVKTPWVVHYPKLIKKGGVSKSLISSIDFSATCLELAGIPKPKSVQGISFTPILKNPDATIRDVVFSQQNWHVYSLHQRMVRFKDFVYIRNNYHQYLNLTDSSDLMYPTGKELWKAKAEGTIKPEQDQTFSTQLEALYDVGKDVHQLNDLSTDPEFAEALNISRKLLGDWTEQTGDTIPAKPTPHRFPPPQIVDGKIIPKGEQTGERNPHAEMPGAARNASKINHPGPVRITKYVP